MRLPILFIQKSWESQLPRWWLALHWSPSGYWQDSRAGRYLRHGIEGALSILIVLVLVLSLEQHTRTSVPAIVSHSSTSASPTITDSNQGVRLVDLDSDSSGISDRHHALGRPSADQ